MEPSRQTSYALSISDALDDDRLQERLEVLSALSQMMPHMGSVCIRDDAMDPESLCETAMAASALGLEIILDSVMPAALIQAAACLDAPALMSQDGDQESLVSISSMCGCPVILSAPDTETLCGLISMADESGIEDVMACPAATSMKGCLESTVRLRRMMESGDAPYAPIASRSWSGEYALAVSTVSLSAGGSLAVLDDLDLEGCAVLEMLMNNLPSDPLIRRGTRISAFSNLAKSNTYHRYRNPQCT